MPIYIVREGWNARLEWADGLLSKMLECMDWTEWSGYALEKGLATKSDEFSENSKRPSTPPHFQKIVLQSFYDRCGCIYAKRYDGQIV